MYWQISQRNSECEFHDHKNSVGRDRIKNTATHIKSARLLKSIYVGQIEMSWHLNNARLFMKSEPHNRAILIIYIELKIPLTINIIVGKLFS